MKFLLTGITLAIAIAGASFVSSAASESRDDRVRTISEEPSKRNFQNYGIGGPLRLVVVKDKPYPIAGNEFGVVFSCAGTSWRVKNAGDIAVIHPNSAGILSPVGLIIPGKWSFHAWGSSSAVLMIYSSDVVEGKTHREVIKKVEELEKRVDELKDALLESNGKLTAADAAQLTYDRIKDVLEKEYKTKFEFLEKEVKRLKAAIESDKEDDK